MIDQIDQMDFEVSSQNEPVTTSNHSLASGSRAFGARASYLGLIDRTGYQMPQHALAVPRGADMSQQGAYVSRRQGQLIDRMVLCLATLVCNMAFYTRLSDQVSPLYRQASSVLLCSAKVDVISSSVEGYACTTLTICVESAGSVRWILSAFSALQYLLKVTAGTSTWPCYSRRRVIQSQRVPKVGYLAQRLGDERRHHFLRSFSD